VYVLVTILGTTSGWTSGCMTRSGCTHFYGVWMLRQ